MDKSTDLDVIMSLRTSAERELLEHLLPFWATKAVDVSHGGFVGRLDSRGVLDPEAPKGAVLNARILWTFAAAARVLPGEEYRVLADRAYADFVARFWDDAYGGVYWMLTSHGDVLNAKKQTYAQAFGLYGLAEYHRMSGSPSALERSMRLFEILENHCRDDTGPGYLDAFSRNWVLLRSERLSEKDLPAPRSANSHLHLLEAFSTLYRVWPGEKVQERQRELIGLFLGSIIDPDTHHMGEAFDEEWVPMAELTSFGHDIEAAWLLTEAAELLGDDELLREVREMAVALADVTLAEGVDADGGLMAEAVDGILSDTDKHWWVQAEAAVGFLNAFEITGDARYLRAAADVWSFALSCLADRDHGEWYLRVSRSGEPYAEDDKVGPWKCPYHSVRACIEIMDRIDRLVPAAT
jgi:mannobiose 2-epimerase